MSDTNPDGLTFDRWTALADARVQRRVGLCLSDLPDGPSWDAWHDGVDPKDYADELLDEEGAPPLESERTAEAVRSTDIRTVPTMSERRAEGRPLANRHIRLALDQRKVTGRMPILY